MKLAGILSVVAALALAAGSGAQMTVGNFTGGDAGEGLDLSGSIVAYNVGGSSSFSIQGVSFAADPGSAVFTSADWVIDPWATEAYWTPEYGDSDNDNALEGVMNGIRANAGQIEGSLAVEAGKKYKLQLLLSENWFGHWQGGQMRIMNIDVSGARVLTGLNLMDYNGLSSLDNPDRGVVCTYEFTATSSTASIVVSGTNVPILNALTLETLAATLPGDANGDSVVDFGDYLILEATYGMDPKLTANWPTENADFDNSGTVDFADYLALEAHYGMGSVPEPMTLSLLGLGSLALIRRRS